MPGPRAQHGIALVEFAITASLLLLITFGITEFGRAIYQYNTLAKAVRDATRYLSTKAPGDADAIDQATCMAVHGNPTCTGGPLAPGLTAEMVVVCDSLSCPATHQAQGAAPVMNLVTVTIGSADTPYPFRSAIQFVVPDFDFAPISVTMKQVL
jgi:Flp pilus assembly protein TadG